jgi:2-keto-3-deoxy-L-rhamnonate aldolase RhmA
MYQHPLLSENKTKEKLEQGEVSLGLFLLTGSSVVAEVCSTLPIDWLMIDQEAAAISKKDTLQIVQAMNGFDVTPIIRVPKLDRHLIEHALDIGSAGILVPKVDTKEEAEQAAQFSHFAPKGCRGINPVRASGYFSNVEEYLATANKRILCMVQIETAEAVKNCYDIASVPDVDVVFIGCGDLAASLGQPGQVTGEKMDSAIEKVLHDTLEAGKIPGIFAYSNELALKYIDMGFKFVAIGNDIKAIRESIINNVEKLKV